MPASIYSYLQSILARDGGITFANDDLPDKDSISAGVSLSFVGGAMEGILTHHWGGNFVYNWKARGMRAAILRYALRPTTVNRDAMSRVLQPVGTEAHLPAVVGNLRVPEARLAAFTAGVRELLCTTPHRNVVKYGLYLLAEGDLAAHRDVVATFARHDEFTLHAIRAVQKSFPNANQLIFQIAQGVQGWGKIHAVEHLEPDTEEIRHWLLCHGCENNVLDDYLSYICAENGRLLEALAQSRIDAELFVGAGVILRALSRGRGPANGLEDYDDGLAVVENYLRHAQTMAGVIEDLMTVVCILGWLDEQDYPPELRALGWTPDAVDRVRQQCVELMPRERWEPVVWACLKSDEPYVRSTGRSAAKAVGVDCWEFVFAQLQENPLDCDYYFFLAEVADQERLQRLVNFALTHLPLAEMSAGPAKGPGLGQEFFAMLALLQALARHEGVGITLIEAALWSVAVNNRNMALGALEAWTNPLASPLIVKRLWVLAQSDPEKDVRQRARELLKRQGSA